MATEASFAQYVCELLRPLGVIRAKKMFGEYGVYCDDVFFALICDGTLYFQVDETIASEFEELEPPYPGAKPAGKVTADILENPEELLRLAKISYLYKRYK